MRSLAVLLLLCSTALAQEPDRRPPHQRDLRSMVETEKAAHAGVLPPAPSLGVPDFTADELIWIRNALRQMASSADPQARRANELAETIVSQHFSRRETPLIMMALSRASRYPEACAIMQRIEPRSVCEPGAQK
jgi:hypothetical protein